ncbi:MAG: FAD-dependent oxidoreductase [Rhodospirillales bacterium]
MSGQPARTYPFVPPPELKSGRGRCPVAVIGAGPVGLTLAIDLARRGVPVIMLDDDDRVSTGSRAICWSKRTLEIWDRLGIAQPIMRRGVTWNRGRVFHRQGQLYEFDLQPEGGQKFPAFINLQQYHVEEALVDAALAAPGLSLRWKNRVAAARPRADGVTLDIETPGGGYALDCAWAVACDGVRSSMRKHLGLDFQGRAFEERFLITDVKMRAEFPTERWFWFDPPFHPGQSALLHRQADDVWRIDFQLGPDADPELENRPERVLPRLKAMLGAQAKFEIEWTSVYSFQCRRLERFRHGRVVFAGDAAHVVSPFGARGGNGGIQDADNLAWKLAAVVQGRAPERLIDSYDAERVPAADENILNSARATDFITPKGAASKAFRDAALALAGEYPFARALINSGRLSTPAVYDASPLSTPDRPGEFASAMRPGSPAANAPLVEGNNPAWLLERLQAGRFAALCFGADLAAPPGVAPISIAANGRGGGLADAEGLAFKRYDARPGTVYLLRPDQHVAARWRRADPAAVAAALARAGGGSA